MATSVPVVELSEDELEERKIPVLATANVPPSKRAKREAAAAKQTTEAASSKPSGLLPRSPFELLRVRQLPSKANQLPHVRGIKELVIGPEYVQTRQLDIISAEAYELSDWLCLV